MIEQSPAPATVSAAPRVPTREAALALTAGFLGWTLDAFDFFLVPISVSAIAEEFRVDDATILFSVTLTLMFRPLGRWSSVCWPIVTAGACR